MALTNQGTIRYTLKIPTVKVIACIEDPAVIKKVLEHLEQCTESAETGPNLAKPRDGF